MGLITDSSGWWPAQGHGDKPSDLRQSEFAHQQHRGYVSPDLDPGSYKVTSAVQASDQFSLPICVRMNA